MTDATEKTAAILYADGSFYSTEQAGGWGVHGYTYTPGTVTTKGTGNKAARPTEKGYAAEGDLIPVESYVDMIGPIDKAKSNNQAEVLAAIGAIKWINESPVKKAVIYSDSEYAVKGITTYMDRWQANGWTGRTGNPIANVDDWKVALQVMEEARTLDKEIKILWIKGHAGHTGNEKADEWAKMGSARVMNGYSLDITTMTSEPNGYWKPKLQFNRLLSHAKLYFDSLDYIPANCKELGGYTYYLGDHGKEVEHFGKPQADASYAVVNLVEPVSVIESIKTHYRNTDTRKEGWLLYAFLPNVVLPNVSDTIDKMGMGGFRKSARGHSMMLPSKKPLTHHIQPTGLAYYGLEELDSLAQKLKMFIQGHKGLICTDITDVLYETVPKKTETELKLRKEFDSSKKHLDVKVQYCLLPHTQLDQMTEADLSKENVRLVFEQDLLKRNSLAAIGDVMDKVYVVTWRESSTVFRFATVIKTKSGDTGIWAASHGNFKLVRV